MNEKFTYKSEWFDIFIVLYLIAAIAATVFSYIAGLILAVAVAPLSILFFNAPGRFTADDSSVSFRLIFKKTEIPYGSIKSIELSREFIKGQLRGEGDRCIETIKFICGNDEYSFNSFIEVDMEAVAKAPGLLAEQFAQSKFSRLKSYIDERAEIQKNGGTPS